MKKTLTIFLLLIATTAFGDNVVTCKSKDFLPEKYEGQALELTIDSTAIVTKVFKVEGSWFCDGVFVEHPRLVFQNQNYKIYDVNFLCDEKYGRLIVPVGDEVKRVDYSFRYNDGQSDKTETSKLHCQRSN